VRSAIEIDKYNTISLQNSQREFHLGK